MNRAAVTLALFLGLAAASQAHAAQKIYSYVPADAATRQRIDSGLTFVFDKGLLGMRVKEILATEAKARAALIPVGDKELGVPLRTVLPAGAGERDLYEVAAEDQGPAMVRAFCPGSTRGWLVFGPMRARRGLVVHALGNDPQTGAPRLCATLSFEFRGEWAIPLRGAGSGIPVSQDPMRPRF
jgi:hypothetical protein